jgi:beta-N-acetylglucosaminidase
MKSVNNNNRHAKRNIGLLYVGIAAFILLAGIAASVFIMAAVLPPVSSSHELSSEEQGIISRTIERTESNDNISSGHSLQVWQKEIQTGTLSLSEFVRLSFTGTYYLLQGKDDASFAKDISFAVYGSDTKADDFASTLSSNSRIYVIEYVLNGVNESYSTSASLAVTDKVGTRVLSVKLEQPIMDEEGYAFGVRSVSGSISIEGDQARTDFYVDNNLRPGQLSIQKDVSGGQKFSMLWDTRNENSGVHSVTVLMRTSDGRGKIISGGEVTIPSFFTLVNDGVQKGSIPSGATDVWYKLDAKDRNAYINFVDLSADISATLYDMYGNRIGRNDLAGKQTEVLRGHKQDLPNQDENDPYVSKYENVFYARVQKGSTNTSSNEVTYLCVQSKEVATDSKNNYLAVTSDVGVVPTPIPTMSVSAESKKQTVTCRDLNADTLTYAMSDLTFLPINGRLASLSFTDPDTAQPVSFYPAFTAATNSYGTVSDKQLTGILSSLSCVEGYAASVSIEQESEDGVITKTSSDGKITITPSRNIVRIQVTDFDQVIHTYTLYLLSGTDKEGYDTATLSLFPQSYRNGIWLLHNLNPTYRFIPYDTGIEWTDLMAAEDKGGKNLADGSVYPNWVKNGSPLYDGNSWRAASSDVVSYFLDPRNFLDSVHVFQFEKLSFDPTVHTLDGVKAMIKGSFMESTDPDYASILLKAGSDAGISPYFLASRIIQEMGRQGDSLLSKGTLPGYEGYFNFYNIGSTPDPNVKNGALINGAKYAKWGSDAATMVITPQEQEFLLPWTSPDLAIRGGAKWIASSYVDIGQNTLYFQKFDVINNADALFSHQYAQNISMAYSEGIRYYRAYLSQNILTAAFQFIIPVYLDMPQESGILPAS